MKGIFVYVIFYLHRAAFFVWVDRSDNDDVRWVGFEPVNVSHWVVSALLKPSAQRWNSILQQTQLKSTDGWATSTRASEDKKIHKTISNMNYAVVKFK